MIRRVLRWAVLYLAMVLAVLVPLKKAISDETKTPKPICDWTVIHYVAGDNDGDEAYGETLKPLKSHMGSEKGLNWIIFADLAPGFARYDDVFGEDFHDTRLYALEPGQFVRQGGGDVLPQITTTSHYEANSGNASTLRDFIRYAKKYYPARHYALIILSHGWGVAMAPDEDEHHSGDALYPAEITDVLSQDDSVDVLVLDVCQFSSAEAMYQWRPGNGRFSTQWLIASPPASSSPQYGELISQITRSGERLKAADEDSKLHGKVQNFRSAELTPRKFADVVFNNFAKNNAQECWGLYDLKHAGDAKAALDGLARAAAGKPEVRRGLEAIRGTGRWPVTMHYMVDERAYDFPFLDMLLNHPRQAIELLPAVARRLVPPTATEVSTAWLSAPYFDMYDFGRRVSESTDLPSSVREAGKNVANAADALVADSFAGKVHWSNFVPGKNGVFFVFPDGDARLRKKSHWEWMEWYTGADMRPRLADCVAKLRHFDGRRMKNLSPEQFEQRKQEFEKHRKELEELLTVKFGYGRLSWAIDGATNDPATVGNWWELLRTWYNPQ